MIINWYFEHTLLVLLMNCTYQYINIITVQCQENNECPAENPVCDKGFCAGMFEIRYQASLEDVNLIL